MGAADAAVVTVKLFAALRDAAGTGAVEVPAGQPLSAVLADLGERFGSTFARRVELAAVMVDGDPADVESPAPLPAGAEVALLPPFAGGAR